MLTVETVDSAAPIRQAEFFRGVSDQDPTIGIVVTADCDLSKKKHWDVLTWIPVVPARSYALSGLLYEEARSLANKHREQVCIDVQRLRADLSLSPLSADLLSAQIGRMENVAELIGGGECPEFVRTAHALLREAVAIIDASPPRMRAWDEAHANSLIAVVKRLAPNTSKLIDKIQSRLATPPSDVFLIPDLESTPHIALLRFLREKPLQEVAPTIGAARSGGVPFYRFAALKSPYRYDLTRRLASVFSDIGLPDSYSTANKAASATIAGDLRSQFG